MGIIDPRLMAVIDPVCKMEIDEMAAKFKSEYKGEKYHFCSLSCKKNSMKIQKNILNFIQEENNENCRC
ncbi:YHS domain-containing protein [Methanohalophilus mahii]|uniref:YHS domain protein n=1 Tax=Methanohalophilus mahii (strain ATCC 35705 / DSM 5219 / SLP) TaxID=547558 RepID=D5E6L9_METMS|nr:YHS domain-containing protein [Methanohalophilus mahii]ADE36807.1 YHS domain protein [Methanohalophilus mahii DSM 5219]